MEAQGNEYIENIRKIISARGVQKSMKWAPNQAAWFPINGQKIKQAE